MKQYSCPCCNDDAEGVGHCGACRGWQMVFEVTSAVELVIVCYVGVEE